MDILRLVVAVAVAVVVDELEVDARLGPRMGNVVVVVVDADDDDESVTCDSGLNRGGRPNALRCISSVGSGGIEGGARPED